MALGDKYVLEVPIGESDSGTVWSAKEASGGRRVVIAMLEEDAPEELKARFEAQAKALCGVHHPNVVRALECGRNEEGAPYLVMERLEGTSLAKRWEAAPPLRADRTIEIGIGVIDALARVHEATLDADGSKLVHGDVEPGNVLLVGAPGKEVAKLIGFGLNRATSRLGSPGSRASLATLQPFAFAAPEQARGDVEASPTADLYSAAALIFAGLTGRPPHTAANATALADALAKDAPPPFASLRKDLAPFAATLDRALASDPNKRYADGQALARALRTALAMGRIVGSKETPVGPRLALAGAEAEPAAPETVARPSEPTVKPSEAIAKPPEVAAKPPEVAAKPSEVAAKPSEAVAKPPEAAAKSSDVAMKPAEALAKPPEEAAAKPAEAKPPEEAATKPPEQATKPPGRAVEPAPTAATDADGPPTEPLAAPDGKATEPVPTKPAGPDAGEPSPPAEDPRASFVELDSSEVELAPASPSARPPPTPPASASTSARPPPKAVHGWMPAPAPGAAAAASAKVEPPPSTTSAARAADEKASPRAPEAAATSKAEVAASAVPPASETATAPVASPASTDVSGDAPLAEDVSPPAPDLSLPILIEDASVPAANGPPLWLVAALAVTVISLGSIYAFVRWGQVEPPPPTGSLGTILTGTEEPVVVPSATVAPREVEPPPATSPPPTTEAEPVIAEPVAPSEPAEPTAPLAPPEPTPHASTADPPRTATPRTTTAARVAPVTGGSTSARAVVGTRPSPTSMATTSMAPTGMAPAGMAPSGMSTAASGRTTVVTDPGF